VNGLHPLDLVAAERELQDRTGAAEAAGRLSLEARRLAGEAGPTALLLAAWMAAAADRLEAGLL
jgi:hypothetical protein